MSYHGNQYRPPPPPLPPRPSYQEQYQDGQGQNGNMHYQQAGGGAQQAYPPRGSSVNHGYSHAQYQPQAYNQQYQPQSYQQQSTPQSAYNPSLYSPQIPQQEQMPAYNPQNYATTANTTPYPTHFNATEYPPDPPAAAATSGPLSDDPYAYQYAPPRPQQHYQQSPPPPSHNYTQNFHQPQHQSPGLDEWRPSPPIYSPALQHANSHQSLPSPPISTPGPTPPAHGLFPRPPSQSQSQSQPRPLPGLPQHDASYFEQDISREEAEALTQEELFSQVENAVLNAGTWSPNVSISAPAVHSPASPRHGSYNNQSVDSAFSPRSSTGMNGLAVPDRHISDDSDAEAAAGLEAMRMDDARDAEEQQRRHSQRSQRPTSNSQEEQRRNSQRSQSHLPPPPQAPEGESESDENYGVDMSMYGGGYNVPLTNVADPNQLGHREQFSPHMPSSQNSSLRRSHASQSSSKDFYNDVNSPGYMHSFTPYNRDARVDAGGTGGNYVPPADGRRASFDEGDEYTFNEGQNQARYPDEPPDFFYHPPQSATYRPLPPPPPFPDAWSPEVKAPPPYAPDGYVVDQQDIQVPRSTSLTSHSNTPQVNAPLRSKTDAEERKRQANRASGYASAFDATPAGTSAVSLDLPSLSAKRFVAAKLGAPDFNKCEEPWALSALLKWLIDVTTLDQTTELKEAAVKEALVNLFTNKVPTMNITDAEILSSRVTDNMYSKGALQVTEEWVRLIPVEMSGVVFQLTGTGCYSPTLHDHIVPGRCYSHYCQRTLKKVNLTGQTARQTEDWATFYKLQKEDIEGKDKKEIEKQNVLHEVVQTEELYIQQLNVLRILYRDPLNNSEPSIITPKRKEKFVKDVFGRVENVKQANEDHLLAQLKYRQQEQGPWIVGFSDIFRQWIRKAKNAYIDYAGSFPGATFMVRQEMERNIQFVQFLDQARIDPRSQRLGWDTYLKTPITRLQRYSLLLQTVLKNMKTDSEERENLKIAIEEVKAVTLECDSRVAEMQRKVDLADLTTKLVLRPGMQQEVELNLNHLGREVLYRGDLQRMGSTRFTWLDSHAILFDHYLVLAKTVTQRAEQGGIQDKYDVSRLPIPMDLLMLESTSDQPIQKSSYVKGITTVTTVSGRAGTPNDVGLTKTSSNQSVPTLAHVNSSQSLQPVTSLDGRDADKILYPFRIKHLGRETYTLFAYSEQSRRDWCNKIIEAKTKHAAALFAQHAEPFRLRVMADSAFVYDGSYHVAQKSVVIRGTPVDRAIKEIDVRFKDTGRPGPVCRARVNCATSFSTPYPGQEMIAVGTDYGVFISPIDNPRGWTKAITMARVTQIAILEEFNLFLLIAEKQLIAYHLDVVVPNERNGPAAANDSIRKAPQKLSGHKDVGFFVTGKMKDRTLVFYKKRENLSSTFKVLEPVYQKSTEKKRGMFKRGNTESFREYDEFYIPTECTAINLFHSSLAVSTSRGFEVLTLDRKQPVSVPDLAPDHVQNIARHLKEQKALCMLRISDQDFLLCYTNCAVYINKHGDISKSVIMSFVGTAQSVAMYGAYIILFDNDFVEIRNAHNGRLKQIIPGRDIKCLDDGGCWTAGNSSVTNGHASISQRTVKFVMQHPEAERTQVVVELLLNEDAKD